MAEHESSFSLRVDTNLTPSYNMDPSPLDAAPPSPRSPKRDRAGSSSGGLMPPLRFPSTSSESAIPPLRGSIPTGTDRARHESRKLLAHVLSQLQHRPMPPSVLASFTDQSARVERGLGAVVRSFAGIAGAGAMHNGGMRRTKTFDESEEEVAEDDIFYTDVTLNLMMQLQDVLAISIKQNWDIFYADADTLKAYGNSNSKPHKRKRRTSHSGKASRSRSRSASPTRDTSIAAPELLSKCVSILASVVVEDCRYQVSSPSPMRPPNALQSITLDIAEVLIFTHQHEPRIVSDIGFAILPAFQTFRPTMHIRLLAFFEYRMLGGMLANLAKVQGRDAPPTPAPVDNDDDIRPSRPPIVSIQVDVVKDETPARSDEWRRWSTSSDASAGLQSTRAPEQSIAVYYLSSLIAPLLAAIMEYVDLSSDSDPTTQRFHRFFRVLMQGKPDVYLDLLEVVAYHTPSARHAGISILARYWPKSLGHLTMSKPIGVAAVDPRERGERRISVTARNTAQDHPYAHQFVPWHFSRPTRPSLFEGLSPRDCRVCSQRIEGFGVLCPFCLCGVHFDCYDYPDGSFFTQYSVGPDVDRQKVAVHRFCHVLPNIRDGSSYFIRKEQHLFRPVNTFSMSLCYLCRQPLWGYVNQGLKCNTCRQFVHASCLSSASATQTRRCRASVVDPAAMTITHAAMRASFMQRYRDLIFTEEELAQLTYEEVSIFHAVLWMQLRILENGLAMGSITIEDDGSDQGSEDEDHIKEFELHDLVRLYEEHLRTSRLPVSSTLMDYLSENQLQSQDTFIFFDWNVLAFIASAVKLPPPDSVPVSSESMQLLSVSQTNERDMGAAEDSTHPYEVVTLAHIRDQLGDVLNVRSETAAQHLLTFMHHVGLLQRLDAQPVLLDTTVNPEQVQCCFPLPFGFDISVDVETLVVAIEACLSDINLSVNEAGFLLLIRRFWPNGMLSEYTFRRLTKAILGWVLSEDNNLAIILRTFVARSKELPGVRSGDPQPWPTQAQTRPTATIPGNGGDYVATRRALLTRYTAPWMLALHDQNLVTYAATVFDLLTEYAEELPYWDAALLGNLPLEESKKRQATVIDTILRYIIKACQAGIVFTVFDDLFQRWLERMDMMQNMHEPLPSLLRLFSLESDGNQRHTIMIDSRYTMGDLSALADVNPLQVMLNIATSTRSGYERGLQWLCVFAFSGVDIPVPIFLQFATLANKFKANLRDCSKLVDAALYSSYLRFLGRLDLQALIAALHVHLSGEILGYLQSSEKLEEVVSFVRRSLAVCLILYGCDHEYLKKIQMIKEREVAHLPSRRKAGSRSSTFNTDPIIVDHHLLGVLRSYTEQKIDELSCLVAKFFHAYINGTRFVESFEVDNFILRNEATLCACTWEFYGIQLPELSMIRPALLVRALVVDPQPFGRLMESLLDQSTAWEIRMETVLRLFRIILDVTSEAFVVEDRQWGPNVIDIFHYFFSSIWTDEREEIRTAVDTWSQTLLPAHKEAIARCWNEALSKAPVAERVKLVLFLLQLHPHFPTWRVLDWPTVVEAISEGDYSREHGDSDVGPLAAHLALYGLTSKEPSYVVELDPELLTLRIGVLSLSLRMIADGLSVDVFTLLRCKNQMARALGYQDAELVPSPSGHTFHVAFNETTGIPAYGYPCISDLMFLLDSAQPFDLPSHAMGIPSLYPEDEVPSPLLVGSLFVDLVISLFVDVEDLPSLPPMSLKNLVKCLLITLQKHDFDSKILRHLQADLRKAVRRCLLALAKSTSVSHEIRQLALSVTHVFVKRCAVGSFIYEAIEEVVQLLVSLDYQHKTDDLLVVQAKNTLESILSSFSKNGVLSVIFRKPVEATFFNVLRYVLDSNAKSRAATGQASLRDELLDDMLRRAMDSFEVDFYQDIVNNLHQYVEVVHHSHYNNDLMKVVGMRLMGISRNTANWPSNTFDASPLLQVCCTLIQHNKSQSRELIGPMENVLRVALIRSRVSAACLTNVLQITGSFYRKIEPREQAFVANVFASAVFEMLSDALRTRSRRPPPTLAAALEAVMESTHSLNLPPARITGLATDGVGYFHTGSLPESPFQDFGASQAVAKMLMQVAESDAQVIASLSTRPLSVRAWNILLLAALSMERSRCSALLLQSFQAFTHAYYTSLTPGIPAAPVYASLEDIDISRAYIAIKLWLLVARRAAQGESDEYDTTGRMESEDAESRSARMIWNQLWPLYETMLTALDREGYSSSSLLLAATSVADLFLFLHQFRSVVGLEMSSHVALLTRLKTNGRAESKIVRTVRSLGEPAPDVPMDYFINQATIEIVAEEKLQVESAKLQEQIKMGAGRRIVS